jgi:membrane protein DedA with SNARE-associated domain/rhodanese-related sulfurtransferase
MKLPAGGLSTKRMDTLVSAVTQHGYAILFTLVFLEAVGLPLPAAPVLLVAGAASANGPLHPGSSLLTALSALVLGDGLMYLLGRQTGWWLLGILCRLSISPESCILRSADAFYKRGRAVLIFAKFVPGINALAAPLAGSMRMRLPQFLAFDLGGASLYTLVYWGIGYLFSGFLGAITKGFTQFGHFVEITAAVLFACYLGYRFLLAFRERNRGPVIRIRAQDAARKLQGVAVFDVRSHGYYEKNTMRIQGSARLEPNALHQEVLPLPKDKEIVLYCTCVREATSVKVAHVLKEQGYAVSVISGGLRAWKKAGLPLEPVPQDDIVQLPTFS